MLASGDIIQAHNIVILFIKHSGDLWRVLKAAVFVFGLTNGCRSEPGVGLLHGTG